jgi:predicted RNase H-like nuclease (RuvC/YqgF family)
MNEVESLTKALDAVQDDTQGQQDPAQDYLDKLVGDGKKYSDTSELAKAYVNADVHIHELREKLDEQSKQQELLKEVLTTLRSQSEGSSGNEYSPSDNGTENSPPDPQDIEKLVDKRVRDLQSQQQAESNVQRAFELLREAYGSDQAVKEAFNRTHGGDQATVKVLDELASTNPEALVRFVKGTTPPERSEGATNVPGVENTGSAEVKMPSGNGFTYSYVKKIRKEDPKMYKSPEFRAKLERVVAEYEGQNKDFFAT